MALAFCLMPTDKAEQPETEQGNEMIYLTQQHFPSEKKSGTADYCLIAMLSGTAPP